MLCMFLLRLISPSNQRFLVYCVELHSKCERFPYCIFVDTVSFTELVYRKHYLIIWKFGFQKFNSVFKKKNRRAFGCVAVASFTQSHKCNIRIFPNFPSADIPPVMDV